MPSLVHGAWHTHSRSLANRMRVRPYTLQVSDHAWRAWRAWRRHALVLADGRSCGRSAIGSIALASLSPGSCRYRPRARAACERRLGSLRRSKRLLWSLVWPDTMLRQANLALTGLAMGWRGSGCVGPRSRDLLGPVGIVDIHTYLHTPCTEGCNDGMKALIWVLRAHWVMSRY